MLSLIKEIGLQNVVYFTSDTPLGQHGNFNRCVELSRTDFLTILHDDDLLVSNYYQIAGGITAFLNDHPSIGLVHQMHHNFYDSVTVEDAPICEIYPISNLTIALCGVIPAWIPSCGIILRREAVIKAGGYNDTYYASGDAFLGGQMLSCGFQIWQMRMNVGYYRISNNMSLKLEICRGFIE